MPSPGDTVLDADGNEMLDADGNVLLFNAAGECPQCCGGEPVNCVPCTGTLLSSLVSVYHFSATTTFYGTVTATLTFNSGPGLGCSWCGILDQTPGGETWAVGLFKTTSQWVVFFGKLSNFATCTVTTTCAAERACAGGITGVYADHFTFFDTCSTTATIS